MRTLVYAACFLTLQSVGVACLADPLPKADNSAQNYGSLDKGAVTAEKQHNSNMEVSVLANVRRMIMAEKGLSMDAKNVKILYAKDGMVTLRGPVDSDMEKTTVEKLAQECPGVIGIKNELTVAHKRH